jgi:succinate dehydrogenase / fumarate reductase membrane anchor subunit
MQRDYRNPLKRARNIGSAKSGAAGWMGMQFTSIVLAVLSVWFVILVLTLVHADYATALRTIGHPIHATLMATFVIVTAWHTEVGLRNIYEDYIQAHWLYFWSIVLTRFALIVLTVLAVLSVVKVMLQRVL